MKKKSTEIISSYFPEVHISKFTSIDGTIEFYNRVNSLLDQPMTVLDFGAGRAAWYSDDIDKYKFKLRLMKGKVEKVIGCDLDSAIFENKSVDESVLINENEPLPFGDEVFDIIVSDWTFEHIANPEHIANEFHRILKKGGWVCARTRNKFSYISLITKIIKNPYHSKILKYVQPERKEIDVFPTTFKLNSVRDISKYFKKNEFNNFTYRYEAEPSYYFNKKIIFLLKLLLDRYLPSVMKSCLFVFLKKK